MQVGEKCNAIALGLFFQCFLFVTKYTKSISQISYVTGIRLSSFLVEDRAEQNKTQAYRFITAEAFQGEKTSANCRCEKEEQTADHILAYCPLYHSPYGTWFGGSR